MLLLAETLPTLRLLSGASACSTAAMAAQLGVRRETMLRSLDQLAQLGVDVVHDSASDALRLCAPCQLLDRDRIASLVTRKGCTVHVLDECASTNEMLRDLALAGAVSGTSLTCEVQSGGRGRLGRRWIAAPGSSVTLSVLWRFEMAVQALGGFPLAIGVATVRALERCGVTGLSLKWPNDVLRGAAKVGGILVETSSVSNACVAIVGVGLNLQLSDRARAQIEAAHGDGAALAPGAITDAHGRAPDRNVVIAHLVDALCEACERFASQGLAAFREDWLARHAYQHAQISVATFGTPPITGCAVDIASDGALIVETARGRQRVHAGDVLGRA